MPSYEYMYLVPREEYERVRMSGQETSRASGNGDTLNGNVQGAAQVNHIEMAEGTKLTIKPNRTIAAASADDEDERDARKDVAGIADRVAREREGELGEEQDGGDLPYVVGDHIDDAAEDGFATDTNEPRAQEEEEAAPLPPVISGVSVGTQADPGPESVSAKTQTAPEKRVSVGTSAKPASASIATQYDPQQSAAKKHAKVQTVAEVKEVSKSAKAAQTEPPPPRANVTTSSTTVQTDPMAKFNLKDMSDLRKKAIMNWTKIRQVQKRGQPKRVAPYVELNDQVPMREKLKMMRQIGLKQLGVNADKTLSMPAITGVNISPSVMGTDTPAKEIATRRKPRPKAKKLESGDARQAARSVLDAVIEKMDLAKQPTKRKSTEGVWSKAKQVRRTPDDAKRKSVEEAIKTVLGAIGTEDLGARQKRVRQTIKNVLAEDDVDMELAENAKPAEDRESRSRSPVKKRQTRSQTAIARRKKKKAEEGKEGEEEMRRVVDERMARLEGKRRSRSKRRADDMEWPEHIEVRSGRSEKKKNKEDE